MRNSVSTAAGVSILAASMLFGAISGLAGEIGFARYYSDGMVLQREKPVVIKGFAPEGTRLTVSFADQEKECVADRSGIWRVTLAPMPANTQGQILTVNSSIGNHQAAISDVLVGDVFLFARQTSIDISLGRDESGKAAASKAGGAGFRVIRIKTVPIDEPQNDLPADATSGWTLISEQEALEMTAATFYAAEGLAKKSEVPVGIVDLNMGYYFPIAWMSLEDLLDTGKVMAKGTGKDLYQSDNAVDSQLKSRTQDLHTYRSGKLQADIETHYEKMLADAKAKGLPVPKKPVEPPDPLQDPRFPAAGYNSVIHPLRVMAFKAVVLQLGNDYPYVLYQKIARDGNATSRAHLGWAWKHNYDIRKWCIYLEPWTIPRVVPQWRQYFADKDLPFGLILPPGSDLGTQGDHHTAVRELQRKVAAVNSGVGLIMPGTASMPFSAQPADEKLLGERALSWVRGAACGIENVASSGPIFERLEADDAKATVFFKKGTSEGLMAEKGALDHFEAAGADAVYYPAKAAIDGSSVRVDSDKVSRIVHVRYNWRQKPDQGLQNSAGLPAVPFRTDEYKYPVTIGHSETDLPEEFSTPARDWKDADVAIISGSFAPGNWHNGEGWLGSCGVFTAPFGPNMGVLHVLKGSPADGKVMVGDLIYDVNGKLLGDDPLRMVADAITYAESEAGNGDIAFGLRRNGKNMNVALKLEVLGTYSATSPYDCPKTDRIVANMEMFLADRGGVMQAHNVFQNSDALFLQGAGTPKYLGLVRRHVYDRMSRVDITKRLDPMTGPFPQNWIPAYDALLTGEYYLATGDRNVLPFLKWCCDYLAMTQNKVEAEAARPWPTALAGQAGGWRHNFYGGQGYGMLPAVGLPALLGFRFAMEAGVDVDREAYKRGLDYFIHNGVRVGSVFYGHITMPVTIPQPIDGEALKKGMLSSSNGAKSLAAILFQMEGDLPTAHLNSFLSAHSYNNCHEGHGGNFWGNAWTALGAYAHSKDAFIGFMQGNTWYRDLHRMYNHSYHQGDRGGIGGGQYLAYVLPRHRLRILGAPESVFAGYPKEFFRSALEAHRQRDYARCAKLVDDLMASSVLSAEDKAKAEQLRRVALELIESIQLDLDKVEGLIKEGKLYEAGLDLPQLEGVVAAGDERLVAIQQKLKAPAVKDAIAQDKARYTAAMKALAFDISIPKPSTDDESEWTCLTPQNGTVRSGFRGRLGSVSAEKATKWRMKVLESIETAPHGWYRASFDDSAWVETDMPIAWTLNHTALFRTTFDLDNRKDIEGLRIRMSTFRQQNMQVFINGKLVAKVNEASNNNDITAVLAEQAVKELKTGKNTIAVTTLNNWRWGSYMTSMETDEANSVRNNGFTLLLDAKGR